MEISVAVQFRQFLLSLAFGVALAVLYDVFRVLRIAFKPDRKAAFFEDVIYMTVSAVITFIFLYNVNSGKLRFFIFFAVASGFLTYYFTLGRLVFKSAAAVISVIRHMFRFAERLILLPIVFVLRHARPIYARADSATKKILENTKKCFIFLLKQYIIRFINGLFKRKEGVGDGKKEQGRSHAAVTCVRGHSHSGNYDSFRLFEDKQSDQGKE